MVQIQVDKMARWKIPSWQNGKIQVDKMGSLQSGKNSNW